MTQSARQILWVVCSLFVIFGGVIEAAEPSLSVTQVGWDGRVFLGQWTPLRVKLTTDSKPQNLRFEVAAPDADGLMAIVPQSGVPLGAEGEFELSVRSGRLEASISIKAFDGETPLASTDYRFSDFLEGTEDLKTLDERLAAIVSPQSDLGQSLRTAFEIENDKSSDSDITQRIAILTSPNFLPQELQNWDSLDVLIISGQLEFTQAQDETMRTWVARGGHLLLSIGGEVEVYSESRFAEWIPARASKPIRLRDLSNLESFARQSTRINPLSRLRATPLEFDRGEILIDSLDGTIAARVSYGFGQVTLVGFDLHRPPLSEWESLPEFVSKLAFPPISAANSEPEQVNQHLTESGISELATQLNLAQQKFSTIQRSSTWTIIGMLSIYLLIIGPLDYLLVHRILKKPELTWLTLPVILVGMMAVTLWAGQSSNSSPLQINQIDIIDVDETLAQVTLHSRISAYSSETQRATVSVDFRDQTDWKKKGESEEDDSTAPDARLDWDSIPEDGFRGLYRKSGLEFASSSYRFDPSMHQIDNLPVMKWSTRSLTAEKFLSDRSLIESDLTASTVGNLSGSLTHSLPGPLNNWILVYRSRVYYPRPTRTNESGIPLQPQVLYEPTRSDLSASRDLKGFLTNTRQLRVTEKKNSQSTAEEKIVTERAPYDPFSDDIGSILRILSFHESVDGTAYTGLKNHALRKFDWSRLLDAEHAVLYGLVDADAVRPVEWNWNGAPAELGHRVLVVRFYLPVTRDQDSRQELFKLDD